MHKQDYNQAVEWNKKHLGITDKLFGKKHLEYASSLSNMALSYQHLGQYQEALNFH